jgi:hypothetical protein
MERERNRDISEELNILLSEIKVKLSNQMPKLIKETMTRILVGILTTKPLIFIKGRADTSKTGVAQLVQ